MYQPLTIILMVIFLAITLYKLIKNEANIKKERKEIEDKLTNLIKENREVLHPTSKIKEKSSYAYFTSDNS